MRMILLILMVVASGGAVIFELSPQPVDHAVWATLKEIREGFRCRQGPPFGGRAPVLSSGNNPIKEASTA